MSQPEWKCVAQLGDASPVEYGGLWVFVDTTGVYAPESEMWDPETRRAYRYAMEDCTWIDGVLSDNKFHPDMSAWFADDLESVSSTMGVDSSDLIEQFTSSDPIERADAWRAIGEYFGWENLDSYPLILSRKEAAARYSEARYQVTEGGTHGAQ